MGQRVELVVRVRLDGEDLSVRNGWGSGFCGSPFFGRILAIPTIGFNLPKNLGNQCPVNTSDIGGFYEGFGF